MQIDVKRRPKRLANARKRPSSASKRLLGVGFEPADVGGRANGPRRLPGVLQRRRRVRRVHHLTRAERCRRSSKGLNMPRQPRQPLGSVCDHHRIQRWPLRCVAAMAKPHNRGNKVHLFRLGVPYSRARCTAQRRVKIGNRTASYPSRRERRSAGRYRRPAATGGSRRRYRALRAVSWAFVAGRPDGSQPH
jgi:hypothetical protein